jgi:hypothetical protein
MYMCIHIYIETEKERERDFLNYLHLFGSESTFSLYHHGQKTQNYCRLHKLTHTILSDFLKSTFNVIAK